MCRESPRSNNPSATSYRIYPLKIRNLGHCSKEIGPAASCRPRLVEGLSRLGPAVPLTLPLQVQRQAALDRPLRPHSVHRLLHLAVPPVPPLYRVRRRPHETLVDTGGEFYPRLMRPLAVRRIGSSGAGPPASPPTSH